MKYIVLVLSLILLSSAVYSQTAQDDLVTDFPGYGNYNYDIYSGFLNTTKDGSRKIHYVLVESMNDPINDPIVVWLNGGPGCSSLHGLIQEIGPFIFTGNNPFLTPNPDFTWNKRYNVLYLEGPPGVGYSINNDPNYQYTEDNTGEDFLQSYVQFRKRFQNVLNVNNDLWITGESYAGMYIPFFTKHILQYNKQNPSDKIPIKGMIIGNGLFLHTKILDDSFYQQYVDNHFFNRDLSADWEYCKDKSDKLPRCQRFYTVFDNVYNNTNHYQIYNYTYSYEQDDSAMKGRFIQDKLLSSKQGSTVQNMMTKLKQSQQYMEDDERATPQTVGPRHIIHQYFNLPEVKKALHVEQNTNEWWQCSDPIFDVYQRGHDSTHLYPSFFEEGLRVLIFSGNTDAVVPHQYTTYCIEDLKTNPRYNVTLTKQGKWRQWYPEGSQQVGGMIQYYKTNTGSEFTYAMVRAAGHEVPEYVPRAAYYMFDNFVQNKPL